MACQSRWRLNIRSFLLSRALSVIPDHPYGLGHDRGLAHLAAHIMRTTYSPANIDQLNIVTIRENFDKRQRFLPDRSQSLHNRNGRLGGNVSAGRWLPELTSAIARFDICSVQEAATESDHDDARKCRPPEPWVKAEMARPAALLSSCRSRPNAIGLTMLSIYILVAIVFAIPTYLEGRNRGEGWSILRVIGLLSCIFWPAVVVCVAALIYKDKRHGSMAKVFSQYRPDH